MADILPSNDIFEGTPAHGDFAKFVEGSTDDDFAERFEESYKERLKKDLYGNH